MAAIDVEREIAHWFTDPALVDIYMAGVKPEHFFDESIREIYQWSVEYLLRFGEMREPPSPEILTQQFPHYPTIIEGTKGMQPGFLAEEMLAKFNKAAIADVMQAAARMLPENPDAATSMLLDGAAMVKRLCRRRTASMVYGEDAELQDAIYHEKRQGGLYEVGAPFPIPEIQEHTGGIRKGEVWPLVASTGTGKTWFACAMARSAALAGWNVYFASLEMPVDEIAERLDIIAAQTVSPIKYEHGALTEEDWARIKAAREALTREDAGRIVIESLPRDSRTVQAIVSHAVSHEADLLIIDQLSQITRRREMESRTVQIEDLVEELKETVSAGGRANPNHLAVLLNAQFNREANKSGQPVGETWNIALSAAIENIADGILAIGQTREMAANQRMECRLLKFRRGPRAEWRLVWDLVNGFRIGVVPPLSEIE